MKRREIAGSLFYDSIDEKEDLVKREEKRQHAEPAYLLSVKVQMKEGETGAYRE